MANRQQNHPNTQYCILVKEPTTGLIVDRFTIEQVETGHKAGTCDHPNYNTVQRHLDELSRRNGLEYSIAGWGDVFPPENWVLYGRLGR